MNGFRGGFGGGFGGGNLQALMKQAEKFDRPIITFIDTPGAYPGIGTEERGGRRSYC